MYVGELIGGRYRLAEKLGAGSFGVVWRAEELFTFRDEGSGTSRTELISDVAIKVFTAQVEVRELQILATCDHSNVLRYRAIVEHEDAAGREYVCLVTELAEGGDVSEMLRGFRKGLPPARVEKIVLPMAEALTYLHGRESAIVHRDVKPQNVLIVGGSYKLGDVGTAKALEGGGTDTSKDQGTIAYTAPERFDGKVVPGADIYSLGVSAFELLTGRLLFTGSPHELMKHHIETRPPIPHELPAHWQELLRRCLAKNPGERWSAEQVVWFLRDRPAEEERKRLETVARQAEELRREHQRLSGELERMRKQTILEREKADTQIHLARVEAQTYRDEAMRLEAGKHQLHEELEAARQSVTTPQLPPTVDIERLHRGGTGVTPRRLQWVLPAIAAAVALLVGIPLGSLLSGGHEEDQPETPVPLSSLGPEQEALGENSSQVPVTSTTEPDTGPPPLNRWVQIEPPASSIHLGLPRGSTDEYGFRYEANILSPAISYEIQQHEVSWRELAPWHTENPSARLTRPERDTDDHPVRGILWETARSYCKTLGGDLPTEEQWEYAARGPQLRNNPWGNREIDAKRTHVFHPGVQPFSVWLVAQDATPGDSAESIHNLLGNVREWTVDRYRLATNGDLWVPSRGRTFRAVRGLPPNTEPPETLPRAGAAFRNMLCTAGPCTENDGELRVYRQVLEYVGFRCVR